MVKFFSFRIFVSSLFLKLLFSHKLETVYRGVHAMIRLVSLHDVMVTIPFPFLIDRVNADVVADASCKKKTHILLLTWTFDMHTISNSTRH